MRLGYFAILNIAFGFQIGKLSIKCLYVYGVKSSDIGDLVMLIPPNVGDQMIMSEFLLVLFSKMIPKTKITFIPS